MFLTISDDSTNEILLQRPIGDSEPLDCERYARQFAAEYFGSDVDTDSGYVPLGCAHFTVELADEPQSCSCWQARSYFVN